MAVSCVWQSFSLAELLAGVEGGSQGSWETLAFHLRIIKPV